MIVCFDCPALHQCAKEGECYMAGYIAAKAEIAADLEKHGMPKDIIARCVRSIERQSKE